MGGTIADQTFKNETIPLEGRRFENCRFINCHFKFSATTNEPEFIDCVFDGPQQVHFVGPAMFAATFLTRLNADPTYEPLKNVEMVFDEPPKSHPDGLAIRRRRRKAELAAERRESQAKYRR